MLKTPDIDGQQDIAINIAHLWVMGYMIIKVKVQEYFLCVYIDRNNFVIESMFRGKIGLNEFYDYQG